MTKAVVAVLVAVVLGFTAAPADARPIHSKAEGRIDGIAACARMVMAEAGETADCTTPTYCPRHRKHRKHHARKHRRHGCLSQIGALAQ